jgi:hypothetical protein
VRAHQAWMSSIQLKATGVVFALTAVLVAFLATYFPPRQEIACMVAAERRERGKGPEEMRRTGHLGGPPGAGIADE